MTLEQLKNKVRDLIGKARIKEALHEIETWAHENNHAQLKTDIALFKSDFATLGREKTLGLVSSGESGTRQNKLTYSILNLLDSLEEVDNQPLESTKKGTKPDPSKPRIYFSYAWDDKSGTGKSREKIVTELYQSLKDDGYQVIRDKEDVDYKGSISDFMREIGRGDTIVVAISDKYLKSANCMFEMLQIYRQSNSDKETLRDKIFPIVLDDAKIYDPIDILDYVEYWKEKKEKLEQKMVKVGLSAAADVIDDFKNFKEITDNVGLISSMIKDMNTRNPRALKKNNFQAIKESLLTNR